MKEDAGAIVIDLNTDKSLVSAPGVSVPGGGLKGEFSIQNK